MTGQNYYLLISTLNINGLNSSIKHHRLALWIKKTKPIYLLSVGDASHQQTSGNCKWKDDKFHNPVQDSSKLLHFIIWLFGYISFNTPCSSARRVAPLLFLAKYHKSFGVPPLWWNLDWSSVTEVYTFKPLLSFMHTFLYSTYHDSLNGLFKPAFSS